MRAMKTYSQLVNLFQKSLLPLPKSVDVALDIALVVAIGVILSVSSSVYAESVVVGDRESVYAAPDLSFPEWRFRVAAGTADSGINGYDKSTGIDFSAVKMLDDSVALEAALSLFPEFAQEGGGTTELEAQTIKFGMAGYSDVINKKQFFMRVGFHQTTVEATVGTATSETTESGMYGGFGASYRLGYNWTLGAEYQRILNVGDTEFDAFLVSLEYLKF